jgi:hypothetical protein
VGSSQATELRPTEEPVTRRVRLDTEAATRQRAAVSTLFGSFGHAAGPSRRPASWPGRVASFARQRRLWSFAASESESPWLVSAR